MILPSITLMVIDLCRMPNNQSVYPIRSAMECIKAPLLTKNAFDQNQITVEKLVELHGFQELANNPPKEYEHLKVNINEELKAIRAKYQDQNNVPAFTYYSDLSALFLKLKDPHTLFVKPKFYQQFKMYFPVQFESKNGFFYMKHFPANSTFDNITKQYEDLYGAVEFEGNDRVFKINGHEPIDYFTYFADKYDYSSKSAHGRLNSQLAGAFYNQRLDVYNVIEEIDQILTIQFLSGKSIVLQFVVKAGMVFNNSKNAIDQYNKEIKNESPYKNVSKTIQQKSKLHKLFEHHESLPEEVSNVEDFKSVLKSKGYFDLYHYKNNDYVLAITSFSPENLTQALKDTIKLLELLEKIGDKKLFISVLKNGGGYVFLGHILAAGLFHNEYPIYGRYNIRKSIFAELFLKGGAPFEDNHRVHWITGKTMSDSLQYNSTVDYNWYKNVTVNEVFSDYFAMDEDQDQEILNLTKQIYASKVKLSPNQVVVISDSQCGSTCACFTKHLVETKNVISLGLGGAYYNKDAFDVGSFAGGAVLDSQEYEDSVLSMKKNGYKGLDKNETELLEKYWLPHNGYLRFAHYIIYSFDSTKEAGTPLEYRSFNVDKVIPIYPTFENWQGVKTLAIVIPEAEKAILNVTAFGKQCNTTNHIIYRQYNGSCQPFGCEHGFYKKANSSSFICEQRVDQYNLEEVVSKALSTGAIVGIILGLIGGTAALFLVAFIVFKKYSKPRNILEELIALADNEE